MIYISEKYQKLPIVGGRYGRGNMPDRESLLSAHITKAVVFYSGDPEESSAASTLKSLDIPAILLKEERIADYAVIFRRLGAKFNIKARGAELALYAEDFIKCVKAMLGDNVSKVKVYFAQCRNGLITTPTARQASCSGVASQPAARNTSRRSIGLLHPSVRIVLLLLYSRMDSQLPVQLLYVTEFFPIVKTPLVVTMAPLRFPVIPRHPRRYQLVQDPSFCWCPLKRTQFILTDKTVGKPCPNAENLEKIMYLVEERRESDR
ncbi:MAG: hypothetical protein LBD73_06435 [Deferribacteraceae bacterium]|nr:hypothetical protein [Deferribacteraceae bacterium]